MDRLAKEVVPGYPAWAGIDLMRTTANKNGRGLPRVGGDRPLSSSRTS